MTDTDTVTVAQLLEKLGFGLTSQGDLDDALRWALIELLLRRSKEKRPLGLRLLPATLS